MEDCVCADAYRVCNKLSGPARNSTLLDNDGTWASILGHDSRDSLKGSHVSSTSGTSATLLGGRIDCDEDNVGFTDALGDVCGEEKVGWAAGHVGFAMLGRGRVGLGCALIDECKVPRAIASNANNVVQARLINGRMA